MVRESLLGVFIFFREYGDSHIALLMQGKNSQRPEDTSPEKVLISNERIKVHGTSLEGNLEGDSPDRDVVVYLPPSYAKSSKQRYPVVYFLHGYSVGVEAYVKLLNLPDMADSAIVMDVGDKDFLNAMNVDLDKELTRLGIPHVFEQYEGDHGNQVAARFQNNLLTFFSQQLKFPEAPRR